MVRALLKHFLSQRQKLPHVYIPEEGDKRQVAKIWNRELGVLGAIHSPVTLGKFLFLLQFSLGLGFSNYETGEFNWSGSF